MSYGHASELAGHGEHERDVDAVVTDPAVLAALAAHDIGEAYRLLKAAGISQRQIARRTGQSQSEVCEILQGRDVGRYDVLVRICVGFGVPRVVMGLSYGEQDTYGEGVTVVDPPEGVSAEMKRRTVVGALTVAALGQSLQGLGELAELALPSGQALPSRLTMSHVHVAETLIERLRGMARQYGGQTEMFAAAARHHTRWLSVPATDAVKARLACALSELHTEAGWCSYEAGLDAGGYFARAARPADGAGDAFGIANAAWHAGATMVRSGHPDDALKCFQLGQFQLSGFQPGKASPATFRTDDPRVPMVTARLDISSAVGYALMDHPQQARGHLARARNNWQPRDVYERADFALNTAWIQRDLGRLDVAEQCAAAAVRTFGDAHRRDKAVADLVLAELHVRAGEPRGLAIARSAVDSVASLHSVEVRIQLAGLARALEARPGSEARELARKARQVAAMRV